jgi:predicted amidophosphoribosyltransferase
MGDILSFDEHRRRHEDDDDRVRCARCGKTILATSLRCPECGVHFQGEAQDFVRPSEQRVAIKPLWVIVAAVLLLIVFVFSALTP